MQNHADQDYLNSWLETLNEKVSQHIVRLQQKFEQSMQEKMQPMQEHINELRTKQPKLEWQMADFVGTIKAFSQQLQEQKQQVDRVEETVFTMREGERSRVESMLNAREEIFKQSVSLTEPAVCKMHPDAVSRDELEKLRVEISKLSSDFVLKPSLQTVLAELDGATKLVREELRLEMRTRMDSSQSPLRDIEQQKMMNDRVRQEIDKYDLSGGMSRVLQVIQTLEEEVQQLQNDMDAVRAHMCNADLTLASGEQQTRPQELCVAVSTSADDIAGLRAALMDSLGSATRDVEARLTAKLQERMEKDVKLQEKDVCDPTLRLDMVEANIEKVRDLMDANMKELAQECSDEINYRVAAVMEPFTAASETTVGLLKKRIEDELHVRRVGDGKVNALEVRQATLEEEMKHLTNRLLSGEEVARRSWSTSEGAHRKFDVEPVREYVEPRVVKTVLLSDTNETVSTVVQKPPGKPAVAERTVLEPIVKNSDLLPSTRLIEEGNTACPYVVPSTMIIEEGNGACPYGATTLDTTTLEHIVPIQTSNINKTVECIASQNGYGYIGSLPSEECIIVSPSAEIYSLEQPVEHAVPYVVPHSISTAPVDISTVPVVEVVVDAVDAHVEESEILRTDLHVGPTVEERAPIVVTPNLVEKFTLDEEPADPNFVDCLESCDGDLGEKVENLVPEGVHRRNTMDEIHDKEAEQLARVELLEKHAIESGYINRIPALDPNASEWDIKRHIANRLEALEGFKSRQATQEAEKRLLDTPEY